jgi:uncharacterized membrane protein
MYIKLFLTAFGVFFLLDMLWLGVVAKGLYAREIGMLLKSDVNWTAAILFYVIFIIGLIVFVIHPAIEKGSWTHAALYGVFFGFVCYATYDLTNLALTKNWPLLITIVDMIWGAVLSASVSVVTYFILTK